MTLQKNLRLDEKTPANLGRHSSTLDDAGFKDYNGPICRSLYGHNIFGAVTSGLCREGHYYDRATIDAGVILYKFALNTEHAFMNMIETLKEQYDEAAKLWDQYDGKLKTFRATVRNDITSIEASARRTTEAVQKMSKAYSDVVGQLNGEPMRQAVENAERLAQAMATLAGLQSHNLAVEVVNKV
jgi:hypothetical protein